MREEYFIGLASLSAHLDVIECDAEVFLGLVIAADTGHTGADTSKKGFAK